MGRLLRKAEEIIKASIAIAKALELNTIGEGIETKEQFDFLNHHGCDAAQGFYIMEAKPMEILSNYISGEKELIRSKDQ